MKRGIIIGLVLVAGLILTSAIYAFGPWGGYGMGYSAQSGGYGTTVDIEAVKKFRKETLPLREELITKRLELQNEYNKTTPDKNRISTLRKEIVDIELKIQEKADASGFSTWGGGMMGSGMMGSGMMGSGMMGPGMMMGRGNTGTGSPCPMAW
ncbi:MAG: hypothetical protein HZA09_05950 [Nitrospirae bacterium]|nr:hypothetical protein [Nitrospirota bacterium]